MQKDEKNDIQQGINIQRKEYLSDENKDFLQVQDSTYISQHDYKYLFNPNKCGECGGQCCYGESGYIFATIAELEEIAKFLNMSLEALGLKYVKTVGKRLSFIEKSCKDSEKGVSCVFFNEDTLQCDIYPVRPKQCQTFPFWDIYKNDQKELFERCIGVCMQNTISDYSNTKIQQSQETTPINTAKEKE